MKTLVFACCCIFAAMNLHSQVIHVPIDYPSIQQGIYAANPGDTIIVADGIYYERINFMGKKPLTIASMFLIDQDASHIDNTILDASQFPYPTNRSLVYFISGEDTTSTLCGFTLRNGEGTQYIEKGKTIKCGGAIFISGSGARIINNRIEHNHLNYNLLGNHVDIFRGAGIGNEALDNDNWVIIENNIIQQNTCISDGIEASGGGISIWGNARIVNNIVVNNTCKGCSGSIAYAGGLYCGTDLKWNRYATVVLSGNTISNNTVKTEDNKASYAGACLQHVIAEVSNNQFVQNQLLSGIYSGGTAGLGIWVPLPGTFVSGNIFSRNSCNMWVGALGIKTHPEEIEDFTLLVEKNYFLENRATNAAGLEVNNVPVCLQNNVFKGNEADSHGGAVVVRQNYTLESYYMVVLVNNSFCDNSASYGGAIYSVKSKPYIINSIFSNNYATIGREIFAPYSKDTVRIAYTNIYYDDVYGNILDKGGNFSGDPMFEDTDLLTLKNTSPCIDKGTAHYTCNHGHWHDVPAFDITSGDRPYNYVMDVGAYEVNNDRSMKLAAGTSPHATFRLYPIPMAQTATFEYELEIPGQVKANIFDLAGRLVASPIDAYQTEGLHSMTWDAGELPSGIYFYCLTINGRQYTGKLVINR